MIHIDLLAGLSLRIKTETQTTFVFDVIRRKWVVLTPEEHVRQALLSYMINQLHYPPGLIAVEKRIRTDNIWRRFDIAVYDRLQRPWMIAECKAPDVPVSEQTLFQLLHYQKSLPCQYWTLCNGISTYCAEAPGSSNINWLPALPRYPF